MTQPNIYVTKPSLPDLDEFLPYLKKIWDTKVLTNQGPFHQQLEEELCEYLGVKYISLFTNGTLALVTALQALEITGEVITTPFSFVATTHSLIWSGAKPVFVDIEPDTLNLDPKKIEAAITPATTAIMAVHCYGSPCDVDAIQLIADEHNLKVIYDAAHAFGVNCHCGSLFSHGNLSVLSFHATKVFNTFEGGAIVCHDASMKERIDQLKNFGIVSETQVVAVGLNGKMSEFNAALGILQLKHVDRAIAQREIISQQYRKRLCGLRGIRIPTESGGTSNYSYFPILLQPDYPCTRDELYQRLKDSGVHARRYFYPLISNLAPYRDLPSSHSSHLPIATAAAQQVLCLPIYPDLPTAAVDHIVDIIGKQKT
jgi:dTDP-4-amino-4,6-dideoxygalactose transaminase